MKKIILVLLIGIFISGCTEEIEEEIIDEEASVEEPIKEKEEILLFQTNHSNCNYLYGEGDIQAQSFKFNFSKLTRAFFLSNLPMRSNKNPQSHVILHIKENNITGKEVISLSKNMRDIKDNNWTEWDFPDINIDKDKKYFFVFECPDCVYVLCAGFCENKNEIICFYSQKGDVYQDGNYWYKSIETDYSIKAEYDEDLAFKIYGIK